MRDCRLRKRRLAARAFALSLAALLALPLTAAGAVYSVPGSFPTIQQALAGAPDGSTVLVSPGVYAETLNAVKLNKDLYLRSSAGAGAVVVDGGGLRTLLRINNSDQTLEKNLVIDGFVFRNGVGSADTAPVSIANAQPTFLNCSFSANSSSGVNVSGAVGIYGGRSRPSFVNCSFTGNRSVSSAGAVLVASSFSGPPFASFKSCLFEGNSNATASGASLSEGGAMIFASAGGVIQDCVFRRNSTDYAGGAVMVLTHFADPVPPQTVTIRGSRFEGNVCQPDAGGRIEPSEGGAVMAEGNVELSVTGSVFSGNVAESGGGIMSYRAHLSVADSVFDGNQASGVGNGFGGGIGVNLDDAGDVDRREAVVSLQRVMFLNNTAPLGGAMLFQGDLSHGKAVAFTMSDVTMASNTASTGGAGPGEGGGLYLSYAALAAHRVYLLRNTAAGSGGAVAVGGNSSLSFTDSVIAGNSASANGAISNPAGAPLTLNATTAAYNTPGAYGGDAAMELLAATPAVTLGGNAYLAAFVAPYPAEPGVSPGGIVLPRLGAGGGFAAAAVIAGNVLEDTSFSLDAAPGVQATVVSALNGLTGTWFRGGPAAVPGVLEAEDFDAGGEKVTYHDLSPANEGGAYRPADGVDIAADVSAGNGALVDRLAAGEWLEYTVASGQDQVFDLWARVAAAGAEGQFAVFVDGVDVTGAVSVPSSGGDRAWNRILAQGSGIILGKGPHQVRVVVLHGGFSLDGLEWTIAGTKSFVALSATPGSVAPGQSVQLAGTLRGWPEGGSLGPLAGESVTLEFQNGGDGVWTLLGAVTTSADGTFFATHAPPGPVIYRATWAGRLIGGVDFPGSFGTVGVQFQPTISIGLGGYRSVRGRYAYYLTGRKVKISGVIVPAQYPGQATVTVQRYAGGRWKSYKSSVRPLDPAGAYRWALKPPVGRYRVKAAFAGDADTAAALSRNRLFIVRLP